jgi:hypothetical protein
VFVDSNDSTYSILPSGYMIIDTAETIIQETRFIRSNTQCAGGGGSRIGQLPDSTFYVFWKVEGKNNGLLGRYYFQNNTGLLDSVSVSSTSQSIQYTDTIKLTPTVLQQTGHVMQQELIVLSLLKPCILLMFK